MWGFYMVDDNKKLVSGYNEAAFQIQRLNFAWIRCRNYAVAGDFKSWRYELDVIWRELSYDIFKKDNNAKLSSFTEGETFKEFDWLDKKITAAEITNNRSLLYRLLSQKESMLRILQNEANKGGHYVDADEDSMD